MEDPQVRRIETTFRHVLGGNAAPFGVGRSSTAASAWPTITASDVKEITRLLDHDNHEMRDKMKEFMKQELFVPVSVPRARAGAWARAKRSAGCRWGLTQQLSSKAQTSLAPLQTLRQATALFFFSSPA